MIVSMEKLAKEQKLLSTNPSQQSIQNRPMLGIFGGQPAPRLAIGHVARTGNLQL
jgi:hypothetical protein